MTVVLITGNLINQFKCLITTALLSAEQKGLCFDVDEFQKVMGERKQNSQHFSMETGGVRQHWEVLGGPQEPGEGSFERGLLTDVGMKQPSETSGIKASPGS